MLSLTSPVRRGLAAGVAGLLVAGTASVLASAPALAAVNADTVGTSFNWHISDQVEARMSTWVYADGAFEKEGKIAAFPQESVTEAAGTLTVEYGGSVETQFIVGGAALYTLKLEDPTVTLAADGSGELSAVVSGMQDYEPAYPYEQTTPTRAVVGEFTSSAGDVASEFTATIDAFSAAFVAQNATGVRPHFNGSSEAKNPSPFTISSKKVAAHLAPDGTSVDVTGTDFFGGDSNYKGVYLGIAPSGGLPDTSSPSGMASFSGQAYLVPEAVVNGAFTTNVAVETDGIKPGVSYSLYSWQAHKHSTLALDTETSLGVITPPKPTEPTPTNPTPTDPPKTVDPAPAPVVKADSKVKVKIAKKPSAKKAGKAVITVKGGEAAATGTIKVTIKVPGKKVKKVNGLLNAKGRVTIKLPKAKKAGKYKLAVKYAGDGNLNKAKQVAKKFRVRR